MAPRTAVMEAVEKLNYRVTIGDVAAQSGLDLNTAQREVLALASETGGNRDAFKKAADFLNNKCNENTYAIVGYQLDKTLSKHGTVSRGVCQVDADNNLVAINERTKIYKNEAGKVIYEDNEQSFEVPADSSVSMNFWCFHPSVYKLTKELFKDFVPANTENIKAEFFIPIIADEFIKDKNNKVKVIPTSSQWFGVTYKEDAPSVKKSIDELISNKTYPVSLWQQEPAV